MNIIGGCCGTTHGPPEGGRGPPARQEAAPAIAQVSSAGRVQSCRASQELVVDQKPLLVGERTNTNGSRKFKQLLEKEDWHGLVEMAQRAGARGRSRPRRVRGLRRPRRRPRHEGGHQALQRGADQADHARQHRSAGDRGRAEAVQRQGDHQLDQPRRRPQDARPEDETRQEVRGGARSRSPSTRRGRPTPRSGSSRSPSASTTSSSTSTASRRGSAVRHARVPASRPGRSRPARAPSPRSKRSGSSSRTCPGR